MSTLDLLKALQQARQQYPDLTTLPQLAITTGKGPGYSEVYPPNEDNNPLPGKLTLQLRQPAIAKLTAHPEQVPSYVALEAIHGLQHSDPIYRTFHNMFKASMTKDQLATSHKTYQRDQKMFAEQGSFDEWLDRAQVPEYIRGYVFRDIIPGWTGPDGDGQYTPSQTKLLDQLQAYLKRGKQEPLR